MEAGTRSGAAQAALLLCWNEYQERKVMVGVRGFEPPHTIINQLLTQSWGVTFASHQCSRRVLPMSQRRDGGAGGECRR